MGRVIVIGSSKEKSFDIELKEKLEKIENMQKQTNDLLNIMAGFFNKAESLVVIKYPSELALQEVVNSSGGCRQGKESCVYCDINVKNRCWLNIKKEATYKRLVAQLPMSRGQLSKLAHRELLMLCKHFGINTFKEKHRSKSALIDIITKASYESPMIANAGASL